MIFGDGRLDLECWRYATEEAAYKGHEETVTVVAATMDDPVIMATTADATTNADDATTNDNANADNERNG
jgi:hypothetical protein